jgi:alkylresorcinol/alkylpyrone synthase
MSVKVASSTVEALPPQKALGPWEKISGTPIFISSIATAVPECVMTIEDVKDYLNKVFQLSESRSSMMLDVIQNAKVERRFLIFPPEYSIEPRSLEQTSKEYLEHSVALGRKVAEQCLKNAGLAAADVDMLITVSCTGVIIPSLDAFLVNDLGFRSDVRRLPITELGCSGGASALGRAWDFLKGVPEGNVLIVSVELPSLTFQRRDMSPANLISSILFGDGAAAVLLTRGNSAGQALDAGEVDNGGVWPAREGGHVSVPKILGTRSHLVPDTIGALGFDLKDGGLHIVLSKDVPELIREKIAGLVDDFLSGHGLGKDDIAAYLLHPGGQKLLVAIEEELSLPRALTQYSWDVLRDYGNQSSASILFVLNEWMTKAELSAGDYGLVAAFGPGFTVEMTLLQWT